MSRSAVHWENAMLLRSRYANGDAMLLRSRYANGRATIKVEENTGVAVGAKVTFLKFSHRIFDAVQDPQKCGTVEIWGNKTFG